MKKYITLIAILFVSISCTNFLDIKPRGKVIPKTASEFATLLHTYLNEIELGEDITIIGNAATAIELEFYADNFDASIASVTVSPMYAGDRINNNQHQYEDNFQVIRDCNIIIDELEDRTSDLAKSVLSTAYAIRGVCYYNMLIRYCDSYDVTQASKQLGLPIVDEFNMEATPIRESLQNTVDFTISTLQTALDYNMQDKKFIFTADVIRAYMARVCFWSEQWGKAIEFAEPLLNKYPITPANEYKNMIADKFGVRPNVIIRSYMYNSTDGVLDWNSAHAEVKKRPVSADFVKSFREGKDDVRYGLVFDNKRVSTKTITVSIRSEEMALIIAESYVHLAKPIKALEYLNLLRSKRITQNYVVYDQNNLPDVEPQLITVDAVGKPLSKLMSVILVERRKEMFAEGDRWFELKRNGSPEFWVANNGMKYEHKGYLYTFPIYKKDVDFYSKLIQNPGYIN